MKTVVFNSPYLDEAEFPDARIGLKRGVPAQVTDEQAAVLLTNPDVTLVQSAAPAAPSAPSAQPVKAYVAAPAPAQADAASEVK